MNTFIFFLALLFLVGCAAAPALQPAGNRTAVQVRSQALTQTAPAPWIDHLFTFKYPVQFTHWTLQSSTNLVDWHDRNDYRIESTNLDGSVVLRLAPNINNPCEFYRIIGDTL